MNAATANGRPKPSLGANATWAFVWSVWLLLLAADLWALSGTSRNVPIGEDWFVVSAFTGNQPDFSSWLWSQNNEHRVPLPRLIMVAMLRLTHGELRSVQVLNILLIAAVAAAFIRKAVSLRDGRYAFSDAVFPLVALHFGHSENMLWAWQITFVCSFVLISIILLQMVDKTGLRSPRAALIGGGALVLLPLTGATGLLFVPLLNGWFIVSGLMQTRRGGEERRAGFILLAAGALTLLVSLIYFVDYEVPPHGATRLPFAQAVRSAALAASFGFGPAARVLRCGDGTAGGSAHDRYRCASDPAAQEIARDRQAEHGGIGSVLCGVRGLPSRAGVHEGKHGDLRFSPVAVAVCIDGRTDDVLLPVHLEPEWGKGRTRRAWGGYGRPAGTRSLQHRTGSHLVELVP